jgi:hypothetical protein
MATPLAAWERRRGWKDGAMRKDRPLLLDRLTLRNRGVERGGEDGEGGRDRERA